MSKLIFSLAALVLSFVPHAYASPQTEGSGWLWNYYGTVNGSTKIAVTLVFQKDSSVSGVFYKHSEFIDYPLQGSLNKRKVSIAVLNTDGTRMAKIEGEFVERDPLGNYSKDTKLESEVIVGTYEVESTGLSLPLYLRLSGGTYGTLDHRYQVAGVQDDSIINKNALALWSAIQSNDAKVIAEIIEYPITVHIGKDDRKIENQKSFIENYEAIFSAELKKEIIESFPHNMFARYDGIMIGNGQIWFNSSGRIIAIQG